MGFTLPFYETSLDRDSWWYKPNIKFFAIASVYPESAMVHVNSLRVLNTHQNGGSYPQKTVALPLFEFLRSNFRRGLSTKLDDALRVN